MSYSPGGYSWLGLAPEPKRKNNAKLTPYQKNLLDHECGKLEDSARSLEKMIHHYHKLCQKYERVAGSDEGVPLLREIDALKNQIDHLSKQISKDLDDAEKTIHPKKISQKKRKSSR